MTKWAGFRIGARNDKRINKDIPCSCILQGVSLFVNGIMEKRSRREVFEPVAAKEIFYKKLLLAGLFAIIELMVEGE